MTVDKFSDELTETAIILPFKVLDTGFDNVALVEIVEVLETPMPLLLLPDVTYAYAIA